MPKKYEGRKAKQTYLGQYDDQLNLRLTSDVRRKVHALAIARGTSAGKMLRPVIERYVETAFKRDPIARQFNRAFKKRGIRVQAIMSSRKK